jgi:molybdopterin molybdotransferase
VIRYEKSQEILKQQQVKTKSIKKVCLSQCLGEILAKDIIANYNLPEFPTSAMDGYAIKYSDQDNEFIQILKDNPAGSEIEDEVVDGSCIKTFTGSLMPKGADTLIPIENVKVVDNKIQVIQKVSFGANVRNVGESFKKGDILIKKGTIINFADIGIMASLNKVMIDIYNKVNVGILSTGSEILDIGETQINNAQIRSSNHFTIEAIAKKYNANAINYGVINDSKKEILNQIHNMLKDCDIVVTTGGVSVGDYDFVKDVVMNELGFEVLFKGVKIKPGQHILMARKDNQFILSLPGFAYSSTVTALFYLVPLIYKYYGIEFELPYIEAEILQDFKLKQKKAIFTACNVKYINGKYYIDFEGKKVGTSAILNNMLGDTGLLFQAQDSKDLQKNEKVKVFYPL